jgi:hypothetical protein
VAIAFLLLIQLFLRTDLSVKLVAATAIRPSPGSTNSRVPGEIMRLNAALGDDPGRRRRCRRLVRAAA